MSDGPLFNLDAMREERASLHERLRQLDGLIAAAESYEAIAGPGGDSGLVFKSPDGSVTMRVIRQLGGAGKSRRAAPVMEATEAVAAELMETTTAPVTTQQLVDAMRERDPSLVPETNPLNVISARMSNSTRFVGRRGKGWWFSDRPWPGDFDPLHLLGESPMPETTIALAQRLAQAGARGSAAPWTAKFVSQPKPPGAGASLPSDRGGFVDLGSPGGEEGSPDSNTGTDQ